MCFSPKVKVPKQDTSVKAVDPAPLTQDNVNGVEFGGQDDEKTSSEVGVKSVTVAKTPTKGIKSAVKKSSTKS